MSSFIELAEIYEKHGNAVEAYKKRFAELFFKVKLEDVEAFQASQPAYAYSEDTQQLRTAFQKVRNLSPYTKTGIGVSLGLLILGGVALMADVVYAGVKGNAEPIFTTIPNHWAFLVGGGVSLSLAHFSLLWAEDGMAHKQRRLLKSHPNRNEIMAMTERRLAIASM